jgi:DNA-binding transcriptional ArsR family regulator
VMNALRALSDPNRLQILRLVSERPRLTSELVAKLALSQPAVHHHIRELWSAELVRQERTRNGMLCAIREDGVRRVIDALSELVEAEGGQGGRTQAVVTPLRRAGRQVSPRAQPR